MGRECQAVVGRTCYDKCGAPAVVADNRPIRGVTRIPVGLCAFHWKKDGEWDKIANCAKCGQSGRIGRAGEGENLLDFRRVENDLLGEPICRNYIACEQRVRLRKTVEKGES